VRKIGPAPSRIFEGARGCQHGPLLSILGLQLLRLRLARPRLFALLLKLISDCREFGAFRLEGP
jgi:hypothetical protein